MEKLKKRSTAATVLLIVVIVGTFFGMIRSANTASMAVEKEFYNGVYLADQKYTEPAIQQLLDKRANAVLGMLGTANKDASLKSEAELLRQSRQALLDAKTIGDKYSANEKMEDAWRKLYTAIEARGTVPDAVKSYSSVLSGAQGAIEKSHYNEAVTRINKELTGIPSSLLRVIGLVQIPDTFGGKSN